MLRERRVGGRGVAAEHTPALPPGFGLVPASAQPIVTGMDLLAPTSASRW